MSLLNGDVTAFFGCMHLRLLEETGDESLSEPLRLQHACSRESQIPLIQRSLEFAHTAIAREIRINRLAIPAPRNCRATFCAPRAPACLNAILCESSKARKKDVLHSLD